MRPEALAMRVLAYVYDSTDADAHVEAVLAAVRASDEPVDLVDVAGGADEREATLAVKRAVSIGSLPETLFDADGRPDFSPGALVTEAPTGRRSLHVGPAAVEAIDRDA